MAKTTVDLVNLLKQISHTDPTTKEVHCAKITIHADGSYLLSDGGNNDVLNSDNIPMDCMGSDIHSLCYMDVTQIENTADDYCRTENLEPL